MCRMGEEGYSCISITTCPCINTFNVLWWCLVVCFLLAWTKKNNKKNNLFVCLYLNVFTLLFFINLLLLIVSKIQKYIKSKKSKKFDWHYCVLLQAYFALYFCIIGLVPLYKWPYAFMSVTCSLCTHIFMGEILTFMWLL